jgi:uncharacterized protein
MTVKKTFSWLRGNQLWLVTLFAVMAFVFMFTFQRAGCFDFWYWMSSNLILLMFLVIYFDREYTAMIRKDLGEMVWRKALTGLLAAVILFLVFYAGNYLIRMIFKDAGAGISDVYSFKQDASPLRIGILMLLVIGPGEEFFWRAYLQRHFMKRFGQRAGFILATFLYAAVHVATGNPVLVLAALVCGLFWGWLYLRYRSMIINVVSHTLWDIAVFLLLPFGH